MYPPSFVLRIIQTYVTEVHGFVGRNRIMTIKFCANCSISLTVLVEASVHIQKTDVKLAAY